MKITLVKGFHLTATERSAISQMIKNGHIQAHNKPKTKMYIINSKYITDGEDYYDILIKTKATWTIGDTPKIRPQYVTIKVKN